MSRLDNWIDNKIAQNLFIWIFVLLIFAMVIQAESRFLTSLLIIGFIIPPIYISNLKILPLFFKEKSNIGFFLYALNITVFTFLGTLFISDFFDDFHTRMILNVFGALLLILLFGTALKLARDSFARRQEEKNAQLKLLKAQLNPHFLFNTLNNLYGLSVVKSDKLPSLMLKLSGLLRYSLYETKEVLVPFKQEITYLENYISLERIRLEDKVDIQFQVAENVSSKEIAPMLFIVFVENAFKHLGILDDGKSSVSITISEKDNVINFTCKNTIDTSQSLNHHLEKGKSGIGLQNAKKRLKLIYPNKHKLTLKEEDESYIVNLKLNF
jgi:hypothetical protein